MNKESFFLSWLTTVGLSWAVQLNTRKRLPSLVSPAATIWIRNWIYFPAQVNLKSHFPKSSAWYKTMYGQDMCVSVVTGLDSIYIYIYIYYPIYIYIYIYIHIYTYMYIYVCVCLCVCILVAFNSMFSIVIVKKISQFPVNQITQI